MMNAEKVLGIFEAGGVSSEAFKQAKKSVRSLGLNKPSELNNFVLKSLNLVQKIAHSGDADKLFRVIKKGLKIWEAKVKTTEWRLEKLWGQLIHCGLAKKYYAGTLKFVVHLIRLLGEKRGGKLAHPSKDPYEVADLAAAAFNARATCHFYRIKEADAQQPFLDAMADLGVWVRYLYDIASRSSQSDKKEKPLSYAKRMTQLLQNAVVTAWPSGDIPKYLASFCMLELQACSEYLEITKLGFGEPLHCHVMDWLYCCCKLLKRSKKSEDMTHVFKVMGEIAPSGKAASREDSPKDISWAYSALTHFNLVLARWGVASQVEGIQEDLKFGLLYIQELMKCKSKSAGKAGLLRKIALALHEIRKAYVDTPSFVLTDMGLDFLKRAMVVLWKEKGFGESEDKESENEKFKLANYQIPALGAAAQIIFAIRSTKGIRRSEKYLQKAFEIAQQTSEPKLLQMVGVSWYNFAASLYKAGHYKHAIKPLSNAGRVNQEANTLKAATTCSDLLYACLAKVANQQGAVELMKSIGWLIRNDESKETRDKFLPRFAKCHIKWCDSADPLTDSEGVDLFEYLFKLLSDAPDQTQLLTQLLVSYRQYPDTVAHQCRILGRLQDVYAEEGRPIQQGRILVDEASVLREQAKESDPMSVDESVSEKEPLNASLTLAKQKCAQALKLFKKKDKENDSEEEPSAIVDEIGMAYIMTAMIENQAGYNDASRDAVEQALNQWKSIADEEDVPSFPDHMLKRTCAMLSEMADWLELQAHFDAMTCVVERLAVLSSELEDAIAAWGRAAFASAQSGDIKRAEEHITKANTMAKKHKASVATKLALRLYSSQVALIGQEDGDSLQEHLSDLIKLESSVQETPALIPLYKRTVANLYLSVGEPAKAVSAAQTSVTILRKLSKHLSEYAQYSAHLDGLALLVNLWLSRGSALEAVHYCRRAVETSTECLAIRRKAFALLTFAQIRCRQPRRNFWQKYRTQKASKFCTQARDLMDAELSLLAVHVKMTEGIINFKRAEKEEALKSFESAEALVKLVQKRDAQNLSLLYASGRISYYKARLYIMQGKTQEAIALLQDALEKPISHEDKSKTLFELAQALLAEIEIEHKKAKAPLKRLETEPTKKTSAPVKRVAKRKNTSSKPAPAPAAAEKPVSTTKKDSHSSTESVSKIIDILKEARSLNTRFGASSLTSFIDRLLSLIHGIASPLDYCFHLSRSAGVSLGYRWWDKHISCEVPTSPDDSVDDLTEMMSKLSTNEKGGADLSSFLGWQCGIAGDEKLDAKSLFAQIDSLPSHWTISTMAVAPNGSHLLLSKCRSNRKPAVVAIPLSSSGHVAVWEEYQTVIDNLKESNTDANAFIRAKSSSRSTTSKEKWWKKRIAIDKEMASFLSSFEDHWLGCWKGMLMGSFESEETQASVKESLKRLLAEWQRSKLIVPKANRPLLRVCIESLPILSPEEMHQCLEFILPSQSETTYESLVEDLQDEKKKRTKEEKRNPLIMIIAGEETRLPWEGLPVLKGHPVCRMPSWMSLFASYSRYPKGKVLDAGKVSYLLNPSGDLEKTQEEFAAYFDEQGWSGTIGALPTDKEIRAETYKGFLAADLFIYCGHNSGEAYLSAARLQQLQKCAVTLLMGCSSARLDCGGDFEPCCLPYTYLLAGCPAVVGNMWDVTSTDLDKFTKALLNEFTTKPESTLLQAMTVARQATKMKHLVGIAAVCYGLPDIYFKQQKD